MKNKAVVILLGAFVGLVFGYFIFGKVLGSYVNISALFDFSGGNLGRFGRSIGGIKAIQQKVLLTALGGAILGFLYSLLKKK